MDFSKIFNSMIYLAFLFKGESQARDFPVSGKIGNTIFTIFICLFTIFPLNYEGALTNFYKLQYRREL
jgi:hypothetical protein